MIIKPPEAGFQKSSGERSESKKNTNVFEIDTKIRILTVVYVYTRARGKCLWLNVLNYRKCCYKYRIVHIFRRADRIFQYNTMNNKLELLLLV